MLCVRSVRGLSLARRTRRMKAPARRAGLGWSPKVCLRRLIKGTTMRIPWNRSQSSSLGAQSDHSCRIVAASSFSTATISQQECTYRPAAARCLTLRVAPRQLCLYRYAKLHSLMLNRNEESPLAPPLHVFGRSAPGPAGRQPRFCLSTGASAIIPWWSICQISK